MGVIASGEATHLPDIKDKHREMCGEGGVGIQLTPPSILRKTGGKVRTDGLTLEVARGRGD